MLFQSFREVQHFFADKCPGPPVKEKGIGFLIGILEPEQAAYGEKFITGVFSAKMVDGLVQLNSVQVQGIEVDEIFFRSAVCHRVYLHCGNIGNRHDAQRTFRFYAFQKGVGMVQMIDLDTAGIYAQASFRPVQYLTFRKQCGYSGL